MTNEERYKKLQQAHDLIREVEFSYPLGSNYRTMLYRGVVKTFSYLGVFSTVMEWIKKDIEQEQNSVKDIDKD